MVVKNKKLLLLLSIPVVLVLGGAAGIFYVMTNMTKPEVTNDINNHFKSLESYSQSSNIEDAEKNDTPNDVTIVHTSIQPSKHSNQKTPPKRHKKKKSVKTRVTKKGITRVAPGTYLLDETLAEDARANQKKYVGTVRAALVKQNGEPKGFMLKNVSKNSYVHAAGLRSGDVVLGVNGHELTDIKKVSLVVANLKYENQFRVDIMRKKKGGFKKMSLYYRVQLKK